MLRTDMMPVRVLYRLRALGLGFRGFGFRFTTLWAPSDIRLHSVGPKERRLRTHNLRLSGA